MPADLLVVNANIYTMDARLPQASTLAVRDGKFLAVGRSGEALEALRGLQTRLLDLQGQTALPGLCDAHIHFSGYALSLQRVDLFEVPSLAEMQRRVAERAAATPAGQWLQGRGWNQNLWPEPRFPTRHALDAAAPDHPVLFPDKSGHAAIANSLALSRAGLSDTTPNPSGGELGRDAAGRLTGLLLEEAIELVRRAIEPPAEADLDGAVLQAQAVAHRLGLTSVHDLDGRQSFGAFQ